MYEVLLGMQAVLLGGLTLPLYFPIMHYFGVYHGCSNIQMSIYVTYEDCSPSPSYKKIK